MLSGISTTIVAQSGTIVWPTACSTNDCPTTYTDPNGVSVTVSGVYGTGTGAVQNQTALIGSTASALGINVSSSATGTTQGLGITLNYTAGDADATVGNRYNVQFNRLLGNLSFPVYDLTSLVLACNFPGSTQAIYNDNVVIYGIDEQNAVVFPTITELARGSWNGTAYDTTNNPSRIINDQYVISGNQVYTTGGHLCTTGGATPCTSGSYASSMDITVAFAVPVKSVHITYKNFNGGLLGGYSTSNNCNNYVTTGGNYGAQTVMVGNFSYNGVQDTCTFTTSISGTDSICPGATSTFTATGGGTYSWSTSATTAAITVSNAGVYTVTVTSPNGCSATATRTLVLRSSPTALITGIDTICAGDTSIFTASGGGLYSWSTSATTASINVFNAGTYAVTVTNMFGCTDIALRSLVYGNPAVIISGSDSICIGATSTLTASGGASYLWSTSDMTSSIVASTAGTYSVTITSANGCTAADSLNLVVSANPTANITGVDTICAGGTSIFTASGGTSYLWSTGALTNTVVVSAAGIYSVTVTNANGCTATAARALVVESIPVVSISGIDTICVGDSSTFSATGGGTYLWNTSNTAAAITVSTAGTYTVTVTNTNGCTATASRSLVVNANPTALITGMDTICSGASSTFTASGGTSYTWSTAATTAALTVTVAGTYTVTVTNVSGCTATASRILVVNANPTASITGIDTICAGATSSFTASGGGDYLWSTGATTATITVSTPGTYTVTVTNANGCTASTSRNLVVHAIPTVDITGIDSICAGSSSTFTASGGGTYLWSTGLTTASVSINSTGIYSVTVTNANGCTASASRNFVVNTNPTASINGVDTICLGSTSTLTATGAALFSWSTGATTAAITVATAGNYYVMITDVNGCTATDSLNLVVNPVPTVSISGPLSACPGLDVTLSASGPSGFIWSTGATGFLIDVPCGTMYSVTGSNAFGCTASASHMVACAIAPNLAITGDTTSCSGIDANLVATGAISYVWNTGSASASIDVPCGSTYTVTGTSSAGCTASLSQYVDCFSNASVAILGDSSICTGDSTLFVVNAGATFLWSTGATTSSIVVSVAGLYAVTITDVNGCTAVASKTLIVNINPSVSITGQDSICSGNSSILTATGTGSFIWSTGATSSNITVNSTGIYRVTLTNASGCTAVDSFELVVLANPTLSITGVDTICAGNTATFTASGTSGSYLWSNGATISTITISASGTYSLTLTDIYGCTTTRSKSLVINSNPIVSISGNDTICAGASSLFTASGGGTYLWSNGAATNTITVTSAGMYTVTVTNSTGCSATSSISLVVNSNPIALVNGVDTICSGNSSTFTASGGTEYLWNTGATTNTITVSVAGTYTVTVTNANSCTATANRILVVNALPVVNIVGTNTICAGTITSFTASGGGSYVWSTGATTASIAPSTAGVYTVTATNASGCTSTGSRTLVVNANPSAAIVGNNVVCFGNTSTFTASGGTQYSWSTGATTASIVVSATGTYTVTVTNAAGCTATTSRLFTVNANPTAGITGTTSVCVGSSSTFTATGGGTYLWNTGATTAAITVSAAGTYSVTVTNAFNCTATAATSLTLIANPVASISGNNVVCSGTSSVFTATGGGTYLWNTGAITAAITVTTAGTYTVTVTNAGGCTATASRAFTVNANPVVTISGNNTICNGNASTFTATGGGTYLWNTGATTASITVSTAAAYTVTVTNATGCTASSTRSLVVNPNPSASITGTNTICAGGTSMFTASGGGTYLWSTGATTAAINVSTAGIYTVTVTNASGCTATSTRTLTVNANPVAAITGTNVICSGTSTTFTASGGGTYLWNTGATTASINISAAGTFTVTVTNANGCTASASRVLTLNANPTASITGTNTICAGSSSVFTASGGGTYLWSTAATTAAITVNTAGTYSVTVTNANGCTATANRLLTVNANPVAGITGTTVICSGATSVFTATGGGTYLWNTAATSASITVSTAGNYTVTVTNANGCTATATASLTVNTNPTATISGTNTICAGASSVFTAAGGNTYVWNTGATTAAITVATAGIYTVTVTNTSGCTATASRTLTVNTNPTASISGNNTICAGASSVFTASGGGTYLWNTSATTATLNVTIAGNYTVTVTNANGCTATATRSLTVNANPVASISGNNVICAGTSTTFTAAGVGTYLWNTGATTSVITVSTAGPYSITVTNASGCTATASSTLTVNTNPIATITGTTQICAGTSTTFNATGGSSYLWSNGATTSSIVVTTAGTYLVTVTDANTCTASANRTLTVNPNPIASISGINSICAGETSSFIASGGSSYLWSTGATTASIAVSIAGSYQVTVIDANGCSATSARALTVNINPTASITGTDTVCAGNSSTFTASGGGLYLWNTGATTSSINVNTPGLYAVTVTNQFGCTATATRTLIVNPNPVVTISGSQVICDGNSSTFTAGVATSYIWNTAATTASITVSTAGTYTVTVTNTFGCTASGSRTLTVNANPVASITGIDSICAGNTSSFSAFGGNAYLWSTGATTASISVTAEGVYTVSVTDINGCTASTSRSLVYFTNPVATITGTNVICAGTSTLFTASGGIGYLWNTGATTAALTLTSSGTYTVTVTDLNGCTASANRVLTINTNPTVTTSGTSFICSGSASTFCATGGVGYLWSNGATTACTSVNTAGAYTVTVTGANGCTATGSRMLIVNPAPTAAITGNNQICVGGSTTFCASGGISYAWGNGSNATCITVSAPGTYTVTATASNNCTAVASTVLIVNQLPTPSINAPVNLCIGESALISVSGGSSYLWSTGATTSAITISPTATSTYSVTASNLAGCTASTSRSVQVNPLPVLNIAGSNTLCENNPSTLVVSGASTYVWSTGFMGNVLSLTPDSLYTYCVTGTTTFGCTATQCATVSPSPNPSITVSDTALCSGQSTTLSTNGGALYLWSTGATTTTITQTPLVSTVYTVTVTALNGCSATATQSVLVRQTPIIDNVLVLNPTTCNINNGSITIFASGNSGTLEYSIDGALWQTNNEFLGLAPNTYVALVRYSGNYCPVSYGSNVVLSAPINPIIAVSGQSGFCSDGQSILTASGGQTYLWSTSATTTSIIINTAGTYTVTGTAANGCTASASILIAVEPVPNVVITGQDTICSGTATNLTATGGVSYVWSNGSTTATIFTSSPGTYTVTVIGSNGCTATSTSTIVIAGLPNLQINGPATICQGASSTLTATGGATYIWSTGQTTASITITPGATINYCVTASNAFGCTATTCRTVSPAPTPSIAALSNSLCAGASTNISANGASSYVWSTGATSPTITVTPLSTTTYTVTATASNGCTAAVSTVVTVTALPVIDSVATTNPSLCNLSNGSIVVHAHAVSGSLQYRLNGGIWQASNIFNGLGAGTYSAEVRYVGGACPVVFNNLINLVAPSSPSITVTGPPSICEGACGTLNVSGAATYIWNTGSTTTSINVCLTTTTTYLVTATAANGCTATSSYTLQVRPKPLANIVAPAAACIGEATSLSASDAGASATYAWTFSNNVTPNTSTLINPSVQFTTQGPESIYLSVTQNGCTAFDTAIVNVNAALFANAGPDANLCAGSSIILGGTSSNPTGPTGATYQWVPAAGLNNLSVSNPVASPSDTTVYIVYVTLGTCVTSDTVVVNVDAISTPFADAGPNRTVCSGSSVVLGGSPSGVAGSTFSWSPTFGLDNPNIANPSASPNANTTYTLTVSRNGCSRQDQVLVEVLNSPFVSAGLDRVYCGAGPGVMIGGTPAVPSGAIFFWTPTTGLNNPLSSNPIAAPSATTTYVLSVSQNGCISTDAVTVTVNPNASTCNYKPLAINDINATFVNTPVAGNVLTNDFDPDNSLPFVLTTTPVVAPSSGTLNLQSSGAYLFTPANNFQGTVTFSYRICDNGLPVGCDTAVVSIEVTPRVANLNLAPLANDDADVTMVGIPVTGNLLANDKDPEAQAIVLNVILLSNPTLGTLALAVNGNYTYTPTSTFPGTDIMSYVVCDQGVPVRCDTASLYVHIASSTSGNHHPFAGDDYNSGFVNTPQTGNLLANDGDLDGNAIIINTSPIVQPLHGTVSISTNGNYTYTPLSNYMGPDRFVYQICDNGAPVLCVQATAYILVNPLRQACFTTKVFLEGAYSVADSLHMYNKLKNCSLLNGSSVIPVAHPYNAQPFNYTGNEAFASAANMPNNMVDWVLVSFLNGACLDSVVYREAAILLRDGSVRRVNGDSVFCVPFVNGQQLRLAIEHRNHVGVMWANALSPVPGQVYTNDFRYTQSYTAMGSSAQKVIGTNSAVLGMYAGDGYKYNAISGSALSNHRVDVGDLTPVLLDNGNFGAYIQGDYNMNCDCSSEDVIWLAPNINVESAIDDCP